MPNTILGGLLQAGAAYGRSRTAEEERRRQLRRQALSDALGLAQGRSGLQTQALQRARQQQLMSGYETPEEQRRRQYEMAMQQGRELYGLQEERREEARARQREQLRPVLEPQLGALQPQRTLPTGAVTSAAAREPAAAGMVGIEGLAEPVQPTAPATELRRTVGQPAPSELEYSDLVGQLVTEGAEPQFLESGLLTAVGAPTPEEQEATDLGLQSARAALTGAQLSNRRMGLIVEHLPEQFADEDLLNDLRVEGQRLSNATAELQQSIAEETAPAQVEEAQLKLRIAQLDHDEAMLRHHAFQQMLESDDPEVRQRALNALIGVQTYLSGVTPGKADLEETLAALRNERAQIQAQSTTTMRYEGLPQEGDREVTIRHVSEGEEPTEGDGSPLAGSSRQPRAEDYSIP